MKTTLNSNFPLALRRLRQALGLPQEAFDVVSSRVYVSSLERGIKDPTLGKVDQLASVMKVHPLTLLALAYCDGSEASVTRLLARVTRELDTARGDQWKT